jgi:hypothetical protein
MTCEAEALLFRLLLAIQSRPAGRLTLAASIPGA